MTLNPFYWHGLHPAKQALFDWNKWKFGVPFQTSLSSFCTLKLANTGSVWKWNCSPHYRRGVGIGLRILIQCSIPRYFTLLFNFTQVLLWSNVIKPYSLNLAGYYFALLRFLLHLAIQLWNQIGFDLISNCLFSVLWTWVSCFCEEEKEHQGAGEEFSHLP